MKCVVCVLVCVVSVVSGANILAVIPTVSKSHYAGFEPLINGLAQRGHNITVITTFPQDRPVDNVHEIRVKLTAQDIANNMPFTLFARVPSSFFDSSSLFLAAIESCGAEVLNNTAVLALLSSRYNFDLVIYEVFLEDVFLAIANRYQVPVIGMSSCTMFPWVADRFGIPDNPASVPVFNTPYTANMDFYQRTNNAFLNVAIKLFYWHFFEPLMTTVSRLHFGSDVPPVSQLVKNVSLYFTNTHFTLFGAQPYPPQVVDVSGLHLKVAKPLPQVLQEKKLFKVLQMFSVIAVRDANFPLKIGGNIKDLQCANAFSNFSQ